MASLLKQAAPGLRGRSIELEPSTASLWRADPSRPCYCKDGLSRNRGSPLAAQRRYLKAAKALGIELSSKLLALADEVIE